MRIDVSRVNAPPCSAVLAVVLAVHLAADVVRSTAPTRQETINGLTLDVSCAPLPGVVVALDDGGSVVSDGKGRFTISRTRPLAVLRASLSGFRNSERALAPGAETARQIRIFLPTGPIEQAVTVSTDGQMVIGATPEPHSLGGRILDSGCRPLAGALVRRDDGSDARRTTADGQFSFEDVRSGTHKLEVTAPGFVRTVVEDVFFNPLNTGRITLALDAGSADERVVISLPRRITALPRTPRTH